jgi:DNA-directed RNA polymerase III subunit RPC6
MGDPQEVMKRMLEIILAKDGIGDSALHVEINKYYPLTEIARVNLLKELGRMGHLRIHKSSSGELVYYHQNPEDAKKLEKLDDNDRIVYQLIQDSKALGMTKLDLKKKSGLTNPKMLEASLKTLDKYGLIKHLKAKDKNRVVYFTADQEADADVVGGRFYSDGVIDEEMIGRVGEGITSIVSSRGKASYSEIGKYLGDNCTEARDLKEEELTTVLNMLIFEDELEEVGGLGRGDYVLAKGGSDAADGFISTPCFVCPVFNECTPGGEISPQTCVYFENW